MVLTGIRAEISRIWPLTWAFCFSSSRTKYRHFATPDGPVTDQRSGCSPRPPIPKIVRAAVIQLKSVLAADVSVLRREPRGVHGQSDLDAVRELNPHLQSFETWLKLHKDDLKAAL